MLILSEKDGNVILLLSLTSYSIAIIKYRHCVIFTVEAVQMSTFFIK